MCKSLTVSAKTYTEMGFEYIHLWKARERESPATSETKFLGVGLQFSKSLI